MKRQIPKNVRQIGNVSDSSKIYVEDYVDTFMNQMCERTEEGTVGAFLLGEIVREEMQDFIYIYGAIHMKELERKGKDFLLGEGVWKNACETCKEFFGNAEILGWVIAGDDVPQDTNHNIQKMHQKYFPREQSVFVTKNFRDKEEKFYIYKFRNMLEATGHYIYYEKNVEMQNYMISCRKKAGLTPSEIIEDRVAKSFRSMIREKEKKNEKKGHSRIAYAISTFLILIIFVIGITVLNDNVKNPTKPVQEESVEQQEEEETLEVLGGDVESEIQSEIQSEIEEALEPEDTHEAYFVQKGDTLETICVKKYGDNSKIKEICELNGLKDGNLIFIGQKLLLP